MPSSFPLDGLVRWLADLDPHGSMSQKMSQKIEGISGWIGGLPGVQDALVLTFEAKHDQLSVACYARAIRLEPRQEYKYALAKAEQRRTKLARAGLRVPAPVVGPAVPTPVP